MRFAKEGIIWVFGISFLTFLSIILNGLRGIWYWVYFSIVTLPIILFLLLTIYFFRDPERTPDPLTEYHPDRSVLSPADGTLCDIQEEQGNLALFIEMHVRDVHVTRAHINGIVKNVIRSSGKHYPIYFIKISQSPDKAKAMQGRAIQKNARVTIECEDSIGHPFIYQLICGKLARRATPYVKVGEQIKQGQKMGIIAFGSMVKVTLPGLNYKIFKKINDSVYGGKTIIGEKITPN